MPRIPISQYGYNFIEQPYVPAGEDEYYVRNQQITEWNCTWRHLTDLEINRLEQLGNTCPNWNDVLVENPIDIELIKGNSFYGLVRIGSMQPFVVGHHDFFIPEGIRYSHIVSCDIGRHSSIHRCGYLSHYIIGEFAIIHEVDELDSTNHAKFGNGVVMENESEDVRIWLGIMNEAEGRKILPFASMICADAWMWATYREHPQLMQRFIELTNKCKDTRRGYYSMIGEHAVIKTCRTIKDVNFGPFAYVKGANKLKNLTVHSDEASPSQIGEGVELVNGIIGYGCHVFYGVKAVRFVMGNNSNLKYGARLLNSVLGDNSTISCCEVLNSLVFPFHEQHHNNSFLIAALVMGQSNMAAGANIGSNHNTRGNDGEFIAGRGFWPALSSSIKYNSKFAPFTIITKGDYPNEMNIPLPFSLVSFHEKNDCLTVMPAYWWMYNRYALERNDWKFRTRDKRKRVVQHIETDYLAPDTVEYIVHAMELLCLWTGKSAVDSGLYKASTDQELKEIGKLLLEDTTKPFTGDVYAKGLERSSSPTHIIKPCEGYHAYKEMLIFFAVKTLLRFLDENETVSGLQALEKNIHEWTDNHEGAKDSIQGPFVNLGGQIVSERMVMHLAEDIVNGSIASWEQVHERYDVWWIEYPMVKLACALRVLNMFVSQSTVAESWNDFITIFKNLCDLNASEVLKTRKKDYDEPFRKCTYRNLEEMTAVLGKPEENSFVHTTAERMEAMKSLAQRFFSWA
ncbi:MAG: DUF4954 family protein [Sphaerochaetaceae bacterium]|jgi:NDP-sugar pyrophosphorylase family protein|nr:DUF4954 family protein [Sphaerochaetaceae bacterium]NLO60597.1 DUF4954 family protein [Spirochaetales bacterium]MDD4259826.1 DUF4954 family protein [Sphaerochaetaceae bacterium]MDD4762709.1 DUF4954 family protein [Sphaerochaetaceae bacterium]MDD4840788.1 DUF4954 family protein [Sphaerochaetaceae bacterium]